LFYNLIRPVTEYWINVANMKLLPRFIPVRALHNLILLLSMTRHQRVLRVEISTKPSIEPKMDHSREMGQIASPPKIAYYLLVK